MSSNNSIVFYKEHEVQRGVTVCARLQNRDVVGLGFESVPTHPVLGNILVRRGLGAIHLSLGSCPQVWHVEGAQETAVDCSG